MAFKKRVRSIRTIQVLGFDIKHELWREPDATDEVERFTIENCICESLDIAVIIGLCVRYAGWNTGIVFAKAITRMLGIETEWSK
jgi:hypothetical protein